MMTWKVRDAAAATSPEPVSTPMARTENDFHQRASLRGSLACRSFFGQTRMVAVAAHRLVGKGRQDECSVEPTTSANTPMSKNMALAIMDLAHTGRMARWAGMAGEE